MGFSADSVDALLKFQALKRTVDEDTLSEYDKERAKADDLYQTRLQRDQ